LNDSLAKAKDLKAELDATKISESDPRYKQYKEYVDLVDSVLARGAAAEKKLSALAGVLGSLKAQLDSNPTKVLTKEEIEKIIEALKNLGKQLDELATEINAIADLMNDDIFGKIKDFLKALKEDSLFDADKKLKQLGQDLQKLEKRIKEVTGENNDFVDFLKDKNTDPNDLERVNLIKALLGESDGSEKQLAGIRGDKDKLNALFEDLKA
jgi:prefoldin subunit 5